MFLKHIFNIKKCQFQFSGGLSNKKRGLKFLSIPSKGLSVANPPPAPQNFLILLAPFLDDLKFHVISPPFLP
jgi:hypothetical protein